MIEKYAVAGGGYVLAAMMFWLLIDAKQDLAAEIESCNTRAETAAREATEAATEARIAAYERQLDEAEELRQHEVRARQIAVKAATEAQNRPERVRTVIREVASENACIDTAVPAAVLDSLRD